MPEEIVFYPRSMAWSECLDAFDRWRNAYFCYECIDDTSGFPLCPEFLDDDEPADVTEDCARRLYAVSGMDPMPIWETAMLIRAKAPHEQVRRAFDRTELLYLLANDAGCTTQTPDWANPTRRRPGRPVDPAVAWRREEVRKRYDSGMTTPPALLAAIETIPRRPHVTLNLESVRDDIRLLRDRGQSSPKSSE